jgi:hypothetical protein
MRDCSKNKVKIWYALRNVIAESDDWGNTKEATTYGHPQEYEISLSANKGEASAQAFGADLKYDREMVTYDTSCPIDEYSRLWIDEPVITGNTIKTVWSENDTIYIDVKGSVIEADETGITVQKPKAHNYEVAAVSRSLNCVRYAIRRVNVSK